MVCGTMTAIGGLGHTLPYLIPDFWTATVVAIAVVMVELVAISYIRHRFMDTPFLAATFQVVVGGALVFSAGIWATGFINWRRKRHRIHRGDVLARIVADVKAQAPNHIADRAPPARSPAHDCCHSLRRTIVVGPIGHDS
jgi:hypothetical protein